jgi:hypothetical protein
MIDFTIVIPIRPLEAERHRFAATSTALGAYLIGDVINR